MKISVITVSYNSVATIADTILSVAGQRHRPVEHLVIDGASTDGTLEVAERHRASLAVLLSEPDQGIYDAMNKGLALATGEVVGFLNADDVYADRLALTQVAEAFADPAVDVCYADLVYVARDDLSKVVRYWRSSPYRAGLFEQGWCPPHPTFFARKRVYERLGGFSLACSGGNDVELMMRFLARHEVVSRHLPQVLVKMRTGGVSNRRLGNIVRQNLAILEAARRHGLAVSLPRFVLGKILSRGRQFLARPKPA